MDSIHHETYGWVTVLWETPTQRALMVRNTSPVTPEHESGFPTWAVSPSFSRIEQVYGEAKSKMPDRKYFSDDERFLTEVAVRHHVSSLENALVHFRHSEGAGDGIEYFGRWLRIFHDGDIATYKDAKTSYVAATTATLREYWGTDSRSVDITEVAAFCEGDVWGYVVEEKVTTEITRKFISGPSAGWSIVENVEEWEELESCWGYYMPEDEAAEFLAAETKSDLDDTTA